MGGNRNGGSDVAEGGTYRGCYADGRLDSYWRPAELLRQEDDVIGEIVAAFRACRAWSGDPASQDRQHASIAIATLQRLGWGPVSGGGPG